MNDLTFIRNFVLILFVFVVSCEDKNDTLDALYMDTAPQGEFLDDWTYEVYPTKYDNFKVAQFRLWLPDNIDDPEAILIVAGSYNSNGLGLILSKGWQEYAIKENLALLSFNLKSQATGKYYADATGGSGEALLKSLEAILDKHDLQKLNTLPFLSRGYSAGGVFSYYFSVFLPERVIAYANIRGTINNKTLINRNIPGLMIMGELDAASRNDNVMHTVLENRMDGGALCFALEPGMDHFGELFDSDELIKQFFSIALKKRLVHGSTQLKFITESSGWLGDNATKEYFEFDTYPNSKSSASWLINENFAISWHYFQLK